MTKTLETLIRAFRPDDTVQKLVLSHAFITISACDLSNNLSRLFEIANKGLNVCCELTPLAANYGAFLKGDVTLASRIDLKSIIDDETVGGRWFNYEAYGKYLVRTLDELFDNGNGNRELWVCNFKVVGLWYTATASQSQPRRVAWFQNQAQLAGIPCKEVIS